MESGQRTQKNVPLFSESEQLAEGEYNVYGFRKGLSTWSDSQSQPQPSVLVLSDSATTTTLENTDQSLTDSVPSISDSCGSISTISSFEDDNNNNHHQQETVKDNEISSCENDKSYSAILSNATPSSGLTEQQVNFWEQVFLLPSMQSQTALKIHILERGGVPHALRRKVWKSVVQEEYNAVFQKGFFDDCCQVTEYRDEHISKAVRQIQLDLDRTFTTHRDFLNNNFQEKLFLILKAYAFFSPSIGYCQGMSYVAATLLISGFDENLEEAFWMFVVLLEKGLKEYYVKTMRGIIRETALFANVCSELAPEIASAFSRCAVDFQLFVPPCFITMFINVVDAYLHWESILVLFDLYFLSGREALYNFALGALKQNQKQICSFNDIEGLLPFLLRQMTVQSNWTEFYNSDIKDAIMRAETALRKTESGTPRTPRNRAISPTKRRAPLTPFSEKKLKSESVLSKDSIFSTETLLSKTKMFVQTTSSILKQKTTPQTPKRPFGVSSSGSAAAKGVTTNPRTSLNSLSNSGPAIVENQQTSSAKVFSVTNAFSILSEAENFVNMKQSQDLRSFASPKKKTPLTRAAAGSASKKTSSPKKKPLPVELKTFQIEEFKLSFK